jgi:hypothetical protein
MGIAPTLTPALLIEALTELGVLACAEGKVIDVAIYGGAALTMVSNFRTSTKDVDAVADNEGQIIIERLAAEIANRRGWMPDWLNDEVFGFLSDAIEGLADHHTYFRSFPSEQEPGLRVFVPTPEYLLAMKLTAMRIGGEAGAKDRADILNLLAIVGLTTREATLAFVSAFYPDAKKSSKVMLGIDELFAVIPVGTECEDDDSMAPTYLGRRGAPHQRG